MRTARRVRHRTATLTPSAARGVRPLAAASLAWAALLVGLTPACSANSSARAASHAQRASDSGADATATRLDATSARNSAPDSSDQRSADAGTNLGTADLDSTGATPDSGQPAASPAATADAAAIGVDAAASVSDMQTDAAQSGDGRPNMDGAIEQPANDTTDAIDPAVSPLAPDQGFQVSTPQVQLPPGAERTFCFHTEVPSDTPVSVARFEFTMSPGCHHLMVFALGTDTAASGTLDTHACNCEGAPLYISANLSSELRMPDGVAFPLAARTRLLLETHCFNTDGARERAASATLTAEYAQGSFEHAGMFSGFSTAIAVPAHAMQTVSGRCQLRSDLKIFGMSIHTHSHATFAGIELVATDEQRNDLVQSTDWEHPMFRSWQAPYFFKLFPGEQLQYTCKYNNPGDSTVLVGSSHDTNDMCIPIALYFPATDEPGSCD